MTHSVREITQRVRQESGFVQALINETGKIIVGQEKLVRRMLIALLSDGHMLIEGVPGLAKTLAVRTLAATINAQFQRVQFTPDLLPSDLIGTQIYNPGTHDFSAHPGPIFSNLVLADEINRAPAKVQSALLEAMEERQVTIGDESFKLHPLYMVLATQNPIEQEGTYPLPEAQLDRFMFMIKLDYPKFADELEVIKKTTSELGENPSVVISKDSILNYQQLIRKVPVADNVFEYAVNLVAKTRPNGEKASQLAIDYLEWGAGPRAGQFLILAAKCNALINGKYSPDMEDIRAVAIPVLRHRIVRNFKAEAEGITEEKIIKDLL